MTDQAASGPVRLQRYPRGDKPQYFSDPATDKLLRMMLELTQELSVARDRIDTLERLIEQGGLFSTSEVEAFRPDETVLAERAGRRRAMRGRVFRATTNELEEGGGVEEGSGEADIASVLS